MAVSGRALRALTFAVTLTFAVFDCGSMQALQTVQLAFQKLKKLDAASVCVTARRCLLTGW
jgi:hypothetical protein